MKNVDSRLIGYIGGGKWNNDTRKFEVGKFKTGKGFGLNLALNVSKKKDDGREYGASVPITMFLDSKEQLDGVIAKIESGMCVVEGYFTPNNYEKEGKTIRGNQFTTGSDKLWTVDEYQAGTSEAKPSEATDSQDEMPW